MQNMRQNKWRARIAITHPHSLIIYNAIYLEEPANPERSRVYMQYNKKTSELILYFEATDFNALRASLLSYIRWIKLTEELINIFKLK